MFRLAVAALAVALIAVTGCGSGGISNQAQLDRIDSCLMKAGFETHQGTFRLLSGPAAGERVASTFVGSRIHPRVELTALTDQILDNHFRTSQGHAELRNTKAEVLGENVLIRPIPYGHGYAPLASVPGISRIKTCATV
jgi:hypothetical protein